MPLLTERSKIRNIYRQLGVGSIVMTLGVGELEAEDLSLEGSPFQGGWWKGESGRKEKETSTCNTTGRG